MSLPVLQFAQLSGTSSVLYPRSRYTYLVVARSGAAEVSLVGLEEAASGILIYTYDVRVDTLSLAPLSAAEVASLTAEVAAALSEPGATVTAGQLLVRDVSKASISGRIVSA